MTTALRWWLRRRSLGLVSWRSRALSARPQLRNSVCEAAFVVSGHDVHEHTFFAKQLQARWRLESDVVSLMALSLATVVSLSTIASVQRRKNQKSGRSRLSAHV